MCAIVLWFPGSKTEKVRNRVTPLRPAGRRGSAKRVEKISAGGSALINNTRDDTQNFPVRGYTPSSDHSHAQTHVNNNCACASNNIVRYAHAVVFCGSRLYRGCTVIRCTRFNIHEECYGTYLYLECDICTRTRILHRSCLRRQLPPVYLLPCCERQKTEMFRGLEFPGHRTSRSFAVW